MVKTDHDVVNRRYDGPAIQWFRHVAFGVTAFVLGLSALMNDYGPCMVAGVVILAVNAVALFRRQRAPTIDHGARVDARVKVPR
jgi:hypothetical protein